MLPISRTLKEPYTNRTFNYDGNYARALYRRIFTRTALFRALIPQALIMSSCICDGNDDKNSEPLVYTLQSYLTKNITSINMTFQDNVPTHFSGTFLGENML